LPSCVKAKSGVPVAELCVEDGLHRKLKQMHASLCMLENRFQGRPWKGNSTITAWQFTTRGPSAAQNAQPLQQNAYIKRYNRAVHAFASAAEPEQRNLFRFCCLDRLSLT